jgi:D-alanyl-D-alanine carboxypeptidase
VFFFWSDVSSQLEPSIYGSAGAMISTEQDLTTFYQALVGGKIVSPASLAQMETTVPSYPGFTDGLGLGTLTLSCGGVAWGHSGEVKGYTSMTVVTTDGRHASVMTNTQGNFSKLGAVLDAALCS